MYITHCNYRFEGVLSNSAKMRLIYYWSEQEGTNIYEATRVDMEGLTIVIPELGSDAKVSEVQAAAIEKIKKLFGITTLFPF